MMELFKKWFSRPRPEKQIAVDVELDGLHPSHIIQLSYLIIEGKRVRGKNFYFRSRAINRYARQVHGLSVSDLRRLSGGQTLADRAEEVYNDFKDCSMVIGHDVAGDVKYIRRELAQYGYKLPPLPVFCTLKHYTEEAHIPRKDNPKLIKPPKLVELTQYFGLSEEFIARKCHRWYGEGGDHPHDARYDAAAAYLVMLVGEKLPCPK